MGEEGEGKYPRYQPDTLAKGPGVHREGVTFSSLLSETRVLQSPNHSQAVCKLINKLVQGHKST